MAPLSGELLWCLSSNKLTPRADGHFRDGSTFPFELGGKGKTHHINNLMHPR